MKIQKALTFRPSSIGDALMGKYFLENIRAQNPEARLAIVVGSRATMLRDLFAGEPWLEVIEANRRSPASLISLWWRWRRSDVVLTYYTAGRLNFSTKFVARLLAIPGVLIGFNDTSRFNHFLYDHLLPNPVRNRSVRLHDRDALTALGIHTRIERLTLNHMPITGVDEKFGIKGAYVIVHLFSGSKSRGLSTTNMRKLLVALSTEIPNTTFVLSGGVGDVAEAIEVSMGLPVVIIAGRASLQELMNLIMGSQATISLDTGVGHLAAHLGRPPIVLSTCLGRISWWGPDQYGPGIPAKLFTRADLCTNGHVFKMYPDCLAAIDMQEVAQTAKIFAAKKID